MTESTKVLLIPNQQGHNLSRKS